MHVVLALEYVVDHHVRILQGMKQLSRCQHS